MLTISKGKLKAQILNIFRDIEATGAEVIVTDNNRPVLKIVPIIQKKSVEELFAPYQGKTIYYEDINTPTLDEWTEV